MAIPRESVMSSGNGYSGEEGHRTRNTQLRWPSLTHIPPHNMSRGDPPSPPPGPPPSPSGGFAVAIEEIAIWYNTKTPRGTPRSS
ncbi:hypothetical protein HYALB_00012799 [Hymenoscyphus albidus]|uniref:Uncharacterized protein n=1 Tax=Hymenoscyphus albidus TaxID=595503 RepID=A0A9N9Q973_9HELO|nr:hypothetical protein HYALB_00012799 [Hymenoscyphus albidus]